MLYSFLLRNRVLSVVPAQTLSGAQVNCRNMCLYVNINALFSKPNCHNYPYSVTIRLQSVAEANCHHISFLRNAQQFLSRLVQLASLTILQISSGTTHPPTATLLSTCGCFPRRNDAPTKKQSAQKKRKISPPSLPSNSVSPAKKRRQHLDELTEREIGTNKGNRFPTLYFALACVLTNTL